ESIILNRATKSLTLYFQMIGRGSRRLPNKSEFTIIDLGNNAARFGLWNEPANSQHIFKAPELYLESLRDDADIEMNFRYTMPLAVRALFANTPDVTFDVDEEIRQAMATHQKSKVVFEKSLEQHARMCVDNADDIKQAKALIKELAYDIEWRMKRYASALTNSSKNYKEWLIEDYKTKLNLLVGKMMREKIM